MENKVYIYCIGICIYIFITSLPSALARGFEWGIYSHDVRTYVRTCPSRLRNVEVTSRWNVAVSGLGIQNVTCAYL